MKRANENGGKEKNKVLCDFRGARIEGGELEEAYAAWEQGLKARKLSPNTLPAHRAALAKLSVYLRALGLEPGTVGRRDLERFRAELVRHDYSLHAVYATVRIVMAFFAFLEETGRIFENPAKGLRNPAPRPRLGTVLSEKQVHRLLAVPDLARPVGLRDRAMLETLYSCGMRLGECAGMRLHDVDANRRQVRVLGKGNKERLLPLGRQAAKYLDLYLREARPLLLPKFRAAPDAFWMSQRQTQMRPGAIKSRMVALGKEAGVDVDVHTLRRTCATHLLRGGAHPLAVSQLLGHASLKTLAHYLQTTVVDLQKAHANSKPGK